MGLLINGSNREQNCYKILNDIKNYNDSFISLSNKDIKYCLGCDKCTKKLDKYCVLNDYITNEVYPQIIDSDKIIIACPIYMSYINGIVKNLIDRLYPFYHNRLLENKRIYLVLTGSGTYEENVEEINDIIKYFNGISEWMLFKFTFLDYFCVENMNDEYLMKIMNIKKMLQK